MTDKTMDPKNSRSRGYYKYSKDALREALEAVQAGMSFKGASNKFKVPRTTLRNRSRPDFSGRTSGSNPVLDNIEENTVECWIHECWQRNMYVGKKNVLNSVAELVSLLNRTSRFANGRPGRGWYHGFLHRHKSAAERLSSNLINIRSPVTEKGMKGWFNKTKLFLKNKGLLNVDPSRVFVMDTVHLCNPESNAETENLSLHVSGNAAGQVAPCMVLFKYQNKIPNKITEKLPNDWLCAKTEDGFMNFQLFSDYITKTFHKWLREVELNEGPIVLFLNGKIPHITLTLYDFCIKNNIELMALHPNASSVLNPLEVQLFPRIKSAWNSLINSKRSKSSNNTLSNKDVTSSLQKMMHELNFVKILKTGFKQSGLYPLSEEKCNYQSIVIKAFNNNNTESVELPPYMPEKIFSTPAPLSNDMYAKTLNCIEELIDEETIQSFKSVDEFSGWSGNVEDTSLFHLWRRLSNLSEADANSMEQEFTDEETTEAANDSLKDPLLISLTTVGSL